MLADAETGRVADRVPFDELGDRCARPLGNEGQRVATLNDVFAILESDGCGFLRRAVWHFSQFRLEGVGVAGNKEGLIDENVAGIEVVGGADGCDRQACCLGDRRQRVTFLDAVRVAFARSGAAAVRGGVRCFTRDRQGLADTQSGTLIEVVGREQLVERNIVFFSNAPQAIAFLDGVCLAFSAGQWRQRAGIRMAGLSADTFVDVCELHGLSFTFEEGNRRIL